MENQPIPIFKSSDTDAFARAVAMLKASGILFHPKLLNEGDHDVPRTAYLILVAPSDEELARGALQGIPSEVTFPLTPSAATRKRWRTLTLIELAILGAILLYTIFGWIRGG